ncbi:kinase-like domain-containing protein [Paraphoma chrysanthemicola]|uniref:Kinase-like domain-containing protein n=1 Tax=Paraphoma chrysanthemicola TaxID=798071 RepID=A0A8K0QTR2_9PLEO|nr:kinase-like domain-containing protein [Paraphoma chrysanthemicola]
MVTDAMHTPRRASTSRSSFSSVQDHETHIQTLSKEIRDAVDSTVEGVVNLDEAQTRCFLAKGDLDRILDSKALSQLFKELLTNKPPTSPRNHTGHGSEPERDNADIKCTANYCIARTTGDSPRVALLALFLYQDREELLSIFMQWVNSTDTDVPSDSWMPFKSGTLDQHGIPKRYHRSIIRDQAIFRPITLRSFEDREIRATDRLPFVGAQTDIKDGSSGTVFNTKIARNHWEIESHNRFVPGNPNEPMVVALKTFIPTLRNTNQATDDFRIELGILKELRRSNIKHDMIMLDMGSITLLDESKNPISHSLIFELATFSLADFLKDERRARTYTTKSLLLARLVEIVEALACLHDNLKTMHLDIKPDNILVFEKGSSRSDIQNPDQRQLIWKLSDFGLARKFGSRQRSGHNRIETSDLPSRSSATPATRPAGIYQAPEIQEKNSSQAGRGSDVWSVGCIALMVMAFVCNGAAEVFKLTTRLSVDFLHGEGCQSLFYVRSDTHPWHDGDYRYRYQYLGDFDPDIGHIPATQYEAAVNPSVVKWSNVLVASYEGQPEQRLIQKWFKIVFTLVLLIDHNKRISAAKLRDRLSDVQQQWRSYEAEPGNFADIAVATTLRPSKDFVKHQPDAASGENTDHPVANTGAPRAAPGVQVHRSPQIRAEGRDALPPHVRSLEHHRHSSHESREIRPSKTLGVAIKDNDAEAVRIELDRDPGQLEHPCSGSILPLHWAISNQAYSALDALLQKSDTKITDIRCRGRTALQLACQGSGDTRTLKCIGRHHQKFNFPLEVYKDNKRRLGAEARKALDDLYSPKDAKEPKKSQTKKFSFFR